jgi:hypothetical protein
MILFAVPLSGVPGLTNEVVFDAKGENTPNLTAAGSAKSIEFKTGDWTVSQTGSPTLTVETGNITSADPATVVLGQISPRKKLWPGASEATIGAGE